MRKKFLIIFVLALFVLSCGTSNVDVKELPNLKETIRIEGLKDKAFNIKISDLVKLEKTKLSAKTEKSDGTKVSANVIGVLLKNFVKKYNKKIEDFDNIRFYGKDGYSIAIPKEMFVKRDICLAYANFDSKLDKKYAPLRVVVKDERATYWCRMVNKIKFEKETQKEPIKTVVLLDNYLSQLNAEYSESEKGQVVKTKDILTNKILNFRIKPSETVYMIAKDGFEKNETMSNFLKGYIKTTGKQAPQFCSDYLPLGMNLDNIISIRVGNLFFYSIKSGGKVKLSEMLEGVEFETSSKYILKTLDSEIAISDVDLIKGMFVKNGSTYDFQKRNGNVIKNVITIKIK